MAVNQYKKDGNGPNAAKKGNRTNSKRDITEAVKISKQRSEELNKYKEAAEKIRRSKKYRQEDLYDIYMRIKQYIRQRTIPTEDDYIDKPLTVSGMILASGISKDVWYQMLNGDYDYRLYEYIDTHDIDLNAVDSFIDGIPVIKDSEDVNIMLIPYIDVLQKAMLAIEAQTEERLYLKGRVGDIFGLKAVHGWREEETPQTINNTLVIADSTEAKRAIDLLK